MSASFQNEIPIDLQDTSSSDKDINLDQIYSCPTCYMIPKIEMDLVSNELNVSVSCQNCSNNQNLFSDTLNKFSLTSFIKELNKKKDQRACNLNFNHGPSYLCCSDCKRFFCKSCSESHKLFCNSHYTLNSNGVLLGSICESERCPYKNKIEFYCDDCKIQCCAKCKERHSNFGHSVTEIEKMLSEEKFLEIKRNFDEICFQMEKEILLYEDAFDSLESRIKICRGNLKEKRIENEELKQFYLSLLNSYSAFKKIPNFNIRNNLIINDFQKIYYKTQSSLESKIHSVLNFGEILNNSFTKEIKQITQIESKYRNTGITYLLVTDKTNKLLTGGGDGKICVYNYNKLKTFFEYEGYLMAHDKVEITCLAEMKENGYILSSALEDEVKLWNIIQYQCICTYKNPLYNGLWNVFTHISLMEKNNICLVDEHYVKILNDEFILRRSIKEDGVLYSKEIKDGSLITCTSVKLKKWNIKPSRAILISEIDSILCERNTSVYYSQNENKLFTVGANILCLIDLNTFTETLHLELEEKIGCLNMLPNGNLLLGNQAEIEDEEQEDNTPKDLIEYDIKTQSFKKFSYGEGFISTILPLNHSYFITPYENPNIFL
ncbi:MAG: hypothetical protein MJ252_28115 [archaeon]|nr:hypothetical protein [archaeon]